MVDELTVFKPRRTLEPRGLGWRYYVGQHNLVLDFAYVRGGDEPTAEVVLTADLPGLPMHLHRSRVRLLGSTSKRELAKALWERSELLDQSQWPKIVEAACEAVLQALRQGAPVEYSAEAAGPLAVDWLVERLLMQGKINLLYGPGGKGKGWLAICAAICVQTGTPMGGLRTQQANVLYYDYEDDKATFDQRVTAVARGWKMPVPRIAYRHGTQRLDSQVEWLAGYCAEAKIGLLIVDSFTFAAGVNGERGGYEESAVRLLTAVQLLTGVTILIIDHVTGDGKRQDGLVGRSYGSIMKENLIRNQLEVKQDQNPGDTCWQVGLYQTKRNHGIQQPPLGFELDFGAPGGGVRITRADVRESTVLNITERAADRIAVELRHEDRSVEWLAARLQYSERHVRRELANDPRFAMRGEGRGHKGTVWGMA